MHIIGYHYIAGRQSIHIIGYHYIAESQSMHIIGYQYIAESQSMHIVGYQYIAESQSMHIVGYIYVAGAFQSMPFIAIEPTVQSSPILGCHYAEKHIGIFVPSSAVRCQSAGNTSSCRKQRKKPHTTTVRIEKT